MSRTRLAGAALLFLALLPGCGTRTADRRPLAGRWQDCWRADRCDATPVGYPGMDGGACAMPTPGTPYQQGPPIYMNQGPPTYMNGPGTSVPFGAETLPQPGGARTMPPQIPPPKIGVDEGKGGKQFELDPASRTGPVGPDLPTGGPKWTTGG